MVIWPSRVPRSRVTEGEGGGLNPVWLSGGEDAQEALRAWGIAAGTDLLKPAASERSPALHGGLARGADGRQRTQGKAGREGDEPSYWLWQLPITEKRSSFAPKPGPTGGRGRGRYCLLGYLSA